MDGISFNTGFNFITIAWGVPFSPHFADMPVVLLIKKQKSVRNSNLELYLEATMNGYSHKVSFNCGLICGCQPIKDFLMLLILFSVVN